MSLADLAAHLDVSRETLRLWLRKWSDFSVLERGTHGQRYSFDPEAVARFVRSRRAPPQGVALDLTGGAMVRRRIPCAPSSTPRSSSRCAGASGG